MFIELTDILRCPQPHEEQFLVLIPDTLDGRSVGSGRLGCPICQQEYPIIDGIAIFHAAPDQTESRADMDASVDPVALAAFLGLGGPGGYAGLVGDVSRLGAGLVEVLAGVHLVGVNPPSQVRELPMLSLVTSAQIPIKSRALRGVILGAGYAGSNAWLEDAARVVLPGLRVVGQGKEPQVESLTLLASAEGWWVAQKV